MTTDLQKPDLSKDTSGPFVTRKEEPVDYVDSMIGDGHAFRHPDGFIFEVRPDGSRPGFDAQHTSDLDIFLAPKEQKTVFVNWYSFGATSGGHATAAAANASAHDTRLALLQLEVDDQGVPVHNSAVRRVEG